MITQEQRERRKQFLGSSDSAAIFDLDPFRSKLDIWWSKQPEAPPEQNKPWLDAGNRLESVIVDYAQDELGLEIERHVEILPADGEFMGANLDGRLVSDPRQGVEAKMDAHTSHGWGDEGSDQIPLRVMIQVHHQIIVGDLDLVWVPVLIPSNFGVAFRMYRVDRNEDLVAQVLQGETDFWTNYVVAGVPPSGDGTPPLEFLKARDRIPDDVIELDDAALDAWTALEEFKLTAKTVAADEEEAKARVLALLGEHEAGRLPDGRVITFLAQNSPARCDAKRLRAHHPSIYDEFFTQGQHRVLRVKAAAKSKRAA